MYTMFFLKYFYRVVEILVFIFQSIVSAAFRPDPRSEVLVEAFSLKITRYDIQSLAGTNWLNDEVRIKLFLYYYVGMN